MNIVPSERPSDIYQLVADKAVEQLEKIADTKRPEDKTCHEEDEVSDSKPPQCRGVKMSGPPKPTPRTLGD